MKDSRPLVTKYYELKIKVMEDLENNKKACNNLLLKMKNSSNPSDKEYYKTWAEIVQKQLNVCIESETYLARLIEEIGLKSQIDEMIVQRSKRQEEIKRQKQIELDNEFNEY